MSSYKLQKIKKYLEKNLKKKFITLSKAFLASSILFVEKKDDSLCFCMNYWKLNALIKRDRYSILLINEVLTWIQDSKYLTQLNIIITVMIESTRWVDEIYKSDMTMWYSKQTQNEYILW